MTKYRLIAGERKPNCFRVKNNLFLNIHRLHMLRFRTFMNAKAEAVQLFSCVIHREWELLGGLQATTDSNNDRPDSLDRYFRYIV